jgi:hypothetical protein
MNRRTKLSNASAMLGGWTVGLVRIKKDQPLLAVKNRGQSESEKEESQKRRIRTSLKAAILAADRLTTGPLVAAPLAAPPLAAVPSTAAPLEAVIPDFSKSADRKNNLHPRSIAEESTRAFNLYTLKDCGRCGSKGRISFQDRETVL